MFIGTNQTVHILFLDIISILQVTRIEVDR